MLLLAALIVAVVKLISIRASYRESAAVYAEIVQEAVVTAAPTTEPIAGSFPSDTSVDIPVTIDWEALQARNADIVAWLYCENTAISYPVTQCRDNTYYLTHNAYKEQDDAGSLFFDCRNNLDSAGENLLLYGHRMKDDSMFGVLFQYTKEAYYLEHPVMYLLTPEKTYLVELFACRTVRGDMKYFETSFESPEEYEKYLNKAVGQSYWQTDMRPDVNHATLTLVTCSSYNHADNPRLMLHGRLAEIG